MLTSYKGLRITKIPILKSIRDKPQTLGRTPLQL